MSLPASHWAWSDLDRFRRCAAQNLVGEIGDRLFARESEDLQHIRFADRVPAKRDELIEHRLRIAQSAFRSARDRMRGRRLERDLFLLRR